MENQQQEKFIVPIGPQHPALKEPGHFEFGVDGEVITSASIRLGFVHRSIEKSAENRSWIQCLYLMERICGICSHIHAMAYSMTVEKLADITVPPRARAIRVMVAELERIHSHLLWLGVGAHEGGFDTLFMYSWRDRETVMDLLEKLSGNRVNYSVNILGGVKFDITNELADEIRKGMDYLEERTHYYLKVVSTDETFIQRTKAIGTMNREEARALGVVGPTARASGVESDIRVDDPYCGYADFPVTMVLDERGDLQARFEVRIKELFESYRIIRETLDNLPSGELSVKVPRRIPEGEVITRLEAPRGELFYYAKSNGGTSPERIKVRTPTLSNFGSVQVLAVGIKLADVPMLLAGIDPCFSCNDRMIRLENGTRDGQLWTWNQLRQHGIEYYKCKM